MPAWAIWLILAAVFAVGEIVTPGLFILGPIGVAAVAAAIVAALGGGWLVQFIVFIVGSISSLLVLRPIARRHIRQPAPTRTGVAALQGARAVVLERVTADGGRVRLGGEVWSARTFLDDASFEPGATVEVLKIEGATALVH